MCMCLIVIFIISVIEDVGTTYDRALTPTIYRDPSHVIFCCSCHGNGGLQAACCHLRRWQLFKALERWPPSNLVRYSEQSPGNLRFELGCISAELA